MRAGLAAGFVVDPWDPSYAAAADSGPGGGLEPSEAELDLGVETPPAGWAPIPARGPAADVVRFIDGVRRVDARVWFPDPAGSTPGLAASYAAGVVVCRRSAELAHLSVERAVVSAAGSAAPIRTLAGDLYGLARPESADAQALMARVQSQMRALELAVTLRAATDSQGELLVLDGPLRGREGVPATIGFIKTHHTGYLPASQLAVVAALRPGERTPVFRVGSNWVRMSWYLRLPGPVAHPWAGIVRCECSAQMSPNAAIQLADTSAATIPHYASEPHKEGRAPANLYPIAGLERALRHRLGDRNLLYRELQRAAARA